ncbi:MAG: trypsin-like peptidase domain-containing protein [Gaiellaceae bacterium]
MKPTRILAPAAALLAAGAIGGLAAVAGWEALDEDPVSTRSATPVPVETISGSESPITSIVKGAMPSVVEVRVESETPTDPFGFPNAPQTGLGSGWLFDDARHVVTNEHVVEGADRVTVAFADGTEIDAEVVGVDRSTDVAVLELSEDAPDSADPLPQGSSTTLQIGDTVIAIGSPMGLQGTVTAGIVSALDRDIEAPDGFTIDGSIQTDAALNRGNSGGPLLDASGRVVGMNAQIASLTGAFSGIGYAIPIETVREIADELIASGEVEHPFLGVQIADDEAGARIAEVVPGSPADDAGLRTGDVVTEAGGNAVESADDLRQAVADREPGDSLELTFERDGDTRTLTVELGRRPSSSA